MESELIPALAEFSAEIDLDRLPPRVVDRAKTCIIDAVACAFAGYQTGICQMLQRALPMAEGGSQQATNWVEGTRAGYFFAAVHNCLLVHNMIHDDMNESCRGHIGNLVVPTTLAMSEVFGSSGKDVLAAIVAGYEVVGRIAAPAVAHSVERGFRGTSTYGPFGVAAAAGRLLGFESEKLAHAISCAASFSSGLVEPFDRGSMEWRLQNGMALMGGIVAALTAGAGFKSSTSVVTGDSGFLKAFCGSDAIGEIRQSWADSLKTLGEVYEVEKTYFKPFATCGYNQIACDVTLKLVERHGITADQVERIEVKVSPDNKSYPGVAHGGPFASTDEALLSKPFTIAAAVVFGDLQVETYGQGLRNPDLLRIARSTSLEAVEGYSALQTEIRIVTRDGKTHTGDASMADLGRFLPNHESMKAKLEMMAGALISRSRQDRILEEISSLEKRKDASALVGLLRRDK
jgi:2-methylcitrate dehydratase PrpD